MAIPLIVGGLEVEKGVEYNGFVPLGNAFRLTEEVRLSVNKSPFVKFPVNEDIYAISSFTYMFEEESSILLTRVVQEDLSIVYNNKCANTVTLVQDVESASICSVTVIEDTTTGSVQCIAYVDHKAGRDIDMNVYVDAVLLGTVTRTWSNDGIESILFDATISTPITASQVVSFTLIARSQNGEAIGIPNPHQTQVKRIS